jgi:hypothetical protein
MQSPVRLAPPQLARARTHGKTGCPQSQAHHTPGNPPQGRRSSRRTCGPPQGARHTARTSPPGIYTPSKAPTYTAAATPARRPTPGRP